MDLISVIIPVYNTAKYLRDCILSVLGQTYTCFEILLIDDGSTDDSAEICRKLCSQDARLRLLCRKHAGVSAARNAGIKEAKGEYLFFLDSDDVIHPQLLEAMHRLMKEKGAAVGTQRRCRVEGESLERLKAWKKEDLSAQENIYLENGKALECRIFADPQTSLSGIGGKMILTDAVGTVRFDGKLTHGEDTLFMYQVLAGGADAVVLCRDWYCYRRHGDGTINKLTSRGCCSIYKAERRIRDQEISYGREENAVTWELAIVNTIIGWYKAGKESNDAGLVRCVKRMADIEKKQKVFFRLDWQKRFEFYILTIGYPFLKAYKIYPFISYLLICYRKVLNQVHIHRWRVIWAYKRIRWKTIWMGQRIQNILRRQYGIWRGLW